MSSRKPRFDIRESGRAAAILFGVLLAANLAFYVLWIRPHERSFSRLDEDGRPQLQHLKAREKAVAAREAYLAALEQAETDLVTLRKDVLSTRERRMIASQLEVASIAREFQVALERIQYENDPMPGDVERFAMVVPLEGGYSNLRRFIQAVESSEKFLVIERVALAQAQDGGNVLQLQITVATYFDSPQRRERRPRDRAPESEERT